VCSSDLIIFKDGSKKFLNEKAYKFVWDESLKGNPIIHIGGQLVNLTSIKVLSSLEDYYVQYPSEKPREKPLYDDFTGLGFSGIINKHKDNKAALNGMIKGLKHYIDGPDYKGTNAPLELLSKMESKLNAI
jgi:hypothetical protein